MADSLDYKILCGKDASRFKHSDGGRELISRLERKVAQNHTALDLTEPAAVVANPADVAGKIAENRAYKWILRTLDDLIKEGVEASGS